MKPQIFVFTLLLLVTTSLHAETMTVTSPDGRQALHFELVGGEPVYRATFDGRPVLEPSRLGFVLEDGTPFLVQPRIAGRRSSGADGSWKPLYGERNEIPDRFNELRVNLVGSGDRELVLLLRAYDEGLAFRYEFPTPAADGNPYVFKEETTEFAFTADFDAWAVYSAQGVYEKVPIGKIKPGCQRPLLVEAGPLRLAVGEARLVDFARMLLEPAPDKPLALKAKLGSKVAVTPSPENPYRTPWRYIAVAESAGKLLEQNYLPLNLNDPCAIEETSWIKPGKIIRETTLTTEGGKACVDFALDRGLQYIELDAGWYGPEGRDDSDATRADFNPEKLDLHEVLRYAEAKGIGVILYVNQRALARQLDDILPLYEKWGVKGIKFGFVHVGSQQWTTWLHEAVKKCADHRIMVDIHDEHRDTGLCRTYPNLMTVEGIRGNEEMPPPEMNVTTALTRMLAGCGDYTPCWYDRRLKTSQAHQLALPVVLYSPWTFLYWYDRPGMYRGEPELELWKELPLVWDETRVLVDRIPDTVAVARRSGEAWYVGILNAGEARSVEIAPLDFCENTGDPLKGTLYKDTSDEPGHRGVTIEEIEMLPADSLEIPLRVNGGAVLKLSIR